LAGTAIPLEARLFAIVDVFDALTSARPYKGPVPLAEAAAFRPVMWEATARMADEMAFEAIVPLGGAIAIRLRRGGKESEKP